jgi:transcription elongation factor Elf1
MVKPPPFEEPDSKNIVPPEDVDAICPVHGFVASITLEKSYGAYVVTCGKCGKQCAIKASSLDKPATRP